jgi:iron complex outermembrane receptor protein
MNRYYFIALVLTVLQNNIANSTETDTIKVKLTEVDITARKNLMAFTPDKTLHQIKKEEIKLMPVASIDGLLEQLASADIRTRGVNGTQADISLRGGTFDQVIVLLNGVNITDPQTGHYNLDIPVDISNIERIEIIQGVQALILGINPYSGAVNIVTKQNTENNVKIKLSGGSFNSYMQNFSVHKAGKRNEITFSASNNQSKGYKPNTDYNMQDAYFQSVFRTKSAGRYELQLAYQQKKYGANGFYSLTYPDQYDNTRTFYGAINWNYAIKNLQLHSQVYYRGHTDRFELFRYPEKIPVWYVGHNYHLNNTSGFKINMNMPIAYGKFTAGGEIRKENIFSSVLGENMEKPIKALFEENAFYSKQSERLISTGFTGIEQ